MEMVGGSWKTYVGVGLEFPWAFGYSVLPGIAYVLRVSNFNFQNRQSFFIHEKTLFYFVIPKALKLLGAG
jgi:hypothetical protein